MTEARRMGTPGLGSAQVSSGQQLPLHDSQAELHGYGAPEYPNECCEGGQQGESPGRSLDQVFGRLRSIHPVWEWPPAGTP